MDKPIVITMTKESLKIQAEQATLPELMAVLCTGATELIDQLSKQTGASKETLREVFIKTMNDAWEILDV